MKKIFYLFILSLSTLIAKAQTPELIFSETNLYLRTVTADSLNYYYFDSYFSTINSLDALGNKTELTTVPNVSASFQDVMICNQGKCIFGNSTSSGTYYFLFNGTSIDTLYESNAQMTFDRIIVGDYVYYHDTKRVYYTDLSSVDNFQILHNASGATDFSGISDFVRLNDKIFFKESDQVNGGSRLKMIDLNTNVVSDLTGGGASQNFNLCKTPNSIILIEEPFGSWARVWETGSVIGFDMLYDGMLAGIGAPSVNKYLGKINNEIYFEGSKSGIPTLLKLSNSSMTTVNHATEQNPYPTMIQSFYQAGDYIYFMASDTNYLNNNFLEQALWVTDGTLNGTRKLIPYGAVDLPQNINLFATTNNPNIYCYNDLWIGYHSDKLVHVNAETNFVESFSDTKNAVGFYPVLNNDFVIFSAKNALGQYQVKKITCSGTLETIEEENTDFNFYPNPTTDGFHLESTKNLKELFITIADAMGKIVLEKQPVESDQFILTNNLQSGVYFISLSHGTTSKSKLLIID